MRRALKVASRVLSFLVLVLGLFVLLVAVIVPRVAGAMPYTVLTDSMAPHYPHGTLIIVRPVDPADLHEGDVVTVQLRSGDPEVVTHRIFQINYGADGTRTFVTKGDANPTPDADVRLPEQIVGRLWYAIPWLGRVAVLGAGQTRWYVTLAAVAALAAYALWQIGKAVQERRKPTDSEGPFDAIDQPAEVSNLAVQNPGNPDISPKPPEMPPINQGHPYTPRHALADDSSATIGVPRPGGEAGRHRKEA